MADSVITFDDVNQLPDPLLSFKWVCDAIPQSFGRMPLTYVESVNLPFPSIQQKEGTFGGGTFSYYPGYETISAFDMTFYEDRTLTTLKYLTKWRERIRDPDSGFFYLPGSYKRDMSFSLLDQQNTRIGTIVMLNCWPTAMGGMDLQYTDSSRTKIQQNFSTDGQQIKFLV